MLHWIPHYLHGQPQKCQISYYILFKLPKNCEWNLNTPVHGSVQFARILLNFRPCDPNIIIVQHQWYRIYVCSCCHREIYVLLIYSFSLNRLGNELTWMIRSQFEIDMLPGLDKRTLYGYWTNVICCVYKMNRYKMSTKFSGKWTKQFFKCI